MSHIMNEAVSNTVRSRLPAIDGLRGLAVLAVLLFHAAIWAGDRESWFWPVLSLGRPGVDLFLVISGFCLFWPLVKGGGGSVSRLELGSFMQRRLWRIYPPYLAALAIAVGASFADARLGGPCWWGRGSFQNVFPLRGLDSLKDFAAHLSLLHGLFEPYAHSIDGAFWSLSLEWQFYMLVPLLVWVARGYGVITAACLTVLTTVVFRVSVRVLNPVWLTGFVGNELCFGRWAAFGAGMFAAAWMGGAIRLPYCRRAPGPFVVVLGVGGAALFEWHRPNSFVLPLVWAVACGGLIWHATSAHGWVRNALEWKPLARLGQISYSLYLIHGSVFMLLSVPFSRFGMPAAWRVPFFILVAPVIAVAFGHAFYGLFERPFLQRYARQRERGGSHYPAAVGVAHSRELDREAHDPDFVTVAAAASRPR